jgi:hypothetical protein
VSLFTDLIYGDVRQRDSLQAAEPLPTSQTSMILAAPLP